MSNNGTSPSPPPSPVRPPESSSPADIRELAAACVRYVKETVGFDLDGTPETLPVVDHWLEQARAAVPEEERSGGSLTPQLRLVVLAAGAYFGEVVLGVHAGWWRGEGAAEERRVELERAFVSFSPMAMAAALVTRPSDEDSSAESEPEDEAESEDGDGGSPRPEMEVEVPPPPESPFEEVGGFLLDEDERALVAGRLAEVAVRTQRDYYALSTKLEVLELCVAALTDPVTASGEPPPTYEPADYDV